MSIFNKILGDPNEKKLNELKLLVEKINSLELEFEKLSDEQLKEKTNEFRKRLEKENLDDLISEAFAVVREAAKRTLGQRHFDVQLLGGIVLHKGQIAEMKTGEGKTLAATLAIYLNSLTERGVHVITVNDYLARRDTNWMGAVYNLLGVSCACLNHEKAYLYDPHTGPDANEVTVEMENLKEVPRKEAYSADITYGTNNEFGFDYLRDNMAPSLEMMVQREQGPYFAIVDEVDSVLIDEARTPLIISAPDAESTKMYEKFAKIVPQLKENTDYNIDEKMRTATLTEEGIAKVEKILGMGNIYEEGGIRIVHHLEQALRAQVMFIKDRHYVVKDGQVIIVDDFTGRLMPGRRYSDGLHQALEAKEGVNVQQESRTLASITFQNYFRMYEKLSGMTGTAVTSAEEFGKVYELEVIVIPTNNPLARQDAQDAVYKTENGKWKAIVREIKKRHEIGQPILIGTVSIEKNELLSKYLKKEGISHQVLNAKYHEQEARIISQAGRKGAVTVATNMAGRGVDIVLGGKGENCQQEHSEVIQAGGLCVIGTERHEARRIDDQLRGRSGRQGDPGYSQFFVSLEDDLMRIFGGEKVQSMMNALKLSEDQPIENKLISRAIEAAQAKIEGYNFDARNHVLEYDDVMNKQREVIYKKRREVLASENLQPQILEMIDNEIKKVVKFHTQANDSKDWNYKEIGEVMRSIFSTPDGFEKKLLEIKDQEEIYKYLLDLSKEAYNSKEKELDKNIRQLEKFVALRNIDMLWMDHIDNMSHLRDSVRLRAYGQKDPLVEYKREGISLFQRLLDSIQSNIVNMIYKFSIAPAGQSSSVVTNNGSVNQSQKAGRNSPCPCGSGKKFKKCCGK
ncbi:preprotein translocase subunit SecA [Patescibacteria group bacterium]